MSIFTRLFRSPPDPREQMRPLWHQVVALARDPAWYAQCKVADTIDGRFDMITAVFAIVLVRIEASENLRAHSALITELFVEDMDGQLRELGTNDVVVGKRMGKLMAAMGGRLGAYRAALESPQPEAQLADAAERNISFAEEGSAQCVAQKLHELSLRLGTVDDEALIAAENLG